jgi:hypothetical protein
MIEMGLLVAVGLLVTLAKMPWRWRMRVLSNPIVMDILIAILLLIIHWGTFSGVMVATIGALFCSLVLSGGRKVFGYMEHGEYVPGIRNVSNKLT